MPPMNNRLLRPTNNYDADALRYINAVQVADGQALEPEVRTAVDAFVRGCKADSAGYAGDPTRTVWDALQACCIMCGARTISGALVPLVGDAPTAEGAWASGDYDRSTGLKGNGSSLYLDSNRADNSEPQNDNHIAVFVTDTGTVAIQDYIGTASLSAEKLLRKSSTGNSQYLNNDLATGALSGYPANGSLFASSRSEASSYTFRLNGASSPRNTTSTGVNALNAFVFARNNNGSALGLFDGSLAFYSLGSALDLALLDNRVSTLISSISTALS